MTDFTVPRDSRRVPLATRVQLKFEWFSGFISEYSANISPGGMFIRTQTPEPVGRLLGFEFRLGDGFELIEGTGEVAWVRPLDQTPEKPAGMGLRFLELSPHSRELIARMVENYIREGGTPFDVTDAPVIAPPVPALPASSFPAAAPEPVPTEPPPAPAEPRPAVVAAPVAIAIPPVAAVAAPSAVAAAPAAVVAERTDRAERGWPGSLAASAVPPPPPAVVRGDAAPPAPASRTAAARPVRLSRVVLWTLCASFLGVAGWIALTQGLFPDWLARRGAVAAPPAPPRHAARPHRSAPAPAAVLPPKSEGAAVVAAAPRGSAAALPAASPSAPAALAAAPGAAEGAASRFRETPERAPPARPQPPPAGAAPLSEIEKITWQQKPDGTEVVLWGNGAFRRQDFVHYRVDGDPPRVLIKVRGIHRPFAESRLIVGTRQVRQVRTGYHDEGAGNELHVVLDLAGFGVEVTGMQEDADKLRIFLKGT